MLASVTSLHLAIYKRMAQYNSPPGYYVNILTTFFKNIGYEILIHQKITTDQYKNIEKKLIPIINNHRHLINQTSFTMKKKIPTWVEPWVESSNKRWLSAPRERVRSKSKLECQLGMIKYNRFLL